jgi:predicted acylesterase/phospholipase RssA
MADEHYFNSIGLCFSGGGYRASSFSLGVLNYLHRIELNSKPLLQRVSAISTVSGGTLTGAAYALAQAKGESFNVFYDNFYNFLNEDKLLTTALGILESADAWKNTTRKRSLINSFAMAYERMNFTGNFGLFSIEKDLKPLRDICFNATEFSYGLAFRFQNTGQFSNYRLSCRELTAVKNQVRVADAVASSSCFPFGFEPMVFPDDYFEDHLNQSYKDLKQQSNFTYGVGIMDGGIVDNQGIGSMIRIDERRKADDKLDLIMVNDVGSYKMDPWVQDEAATTGKKESLKNALLNGLRYLKLRWYYWVTGLLGVIVCILNSMNIFGPQQYAALYVVGGALAGAGLILTVIGLILTILTALGMVWVKSAFKNAIPAELIDDVGAFTKLDVALVKRMIIERLTSTLKMVNDVFLKQVRRLNYDLLYSSEKYKHKAITSTVYQLNGKETLFSNRKLNENIKPPSARLTEVALIASEMPTTLWWDAQDRHLNRLNCLIACGQFTTCYNLIDYIQKIPEAARTPDILSMKQALEKDWDEFVKDAFFLVRVGGK